MRQSIQTKQDIYAELAKLAREFEDAENALREAKQANLSTLTIKVLMEVRDKAEDKLVNASNMKMTPVLAQQF